ncbi:MAG TPA: M3 family oligoendopeptidase, partial [Roseiflexaceae bacterium]|nr:M3 family oligoendopeptidase [Roseiflexaceae bacterium]
LRAYLHSFVSTDSRNAQAQALMSQFQQRMVRYAQLDTYWTKWLGSVDAEQLVAHSELANAYGYVVRRAQIEASHQMSTAEELLASELSVSGGDAWARLYGDVSSQLVVPVEHPDGRRDMPMTLVRNLAYDARRDVRAAGYNAEMEGWQRAEVPLAAAMNGVKGEFGTLGQKRRWDSPLELALFSNNIDQATLNAMMAAAHDSFPDFRRYLRAKARLLGQEQLAWYDLFAPVGGDTPRVWQFGEARHFIVEQFASYSEPLAALAQRAFEERWIDAEPRAGKRGGAFCMSLRGDESRILANYAPTIGNVMTLAHELGHAYHNATLAPQQPLNRTTPMTLAETASIFCETLVRQAALSHADADEQLEILESSLQGACQVVVDITSRFLFEQAVFEQRKQRALGAEELCALMLDAQRATYGDGLDGALLHQYAWAAKPHYYSSTRAFYNFPYMFGLLFGLGLFAMYNNSPNGFHERYNALLASTGQGDAAELAARVGIDIRSQDFWRASLDTIRADVDRFEQIVAAKTGGSR